MPSKQKCVLCNKRYATTRDHVPPKGCFAKPLPNDLITIPSCLKCNRDGSKFDEKFRVYLSLHVGIDTPRTKALWKNHAVRTIQHNKRLRNKIVGSMRPVTVKSPGGIILSRETGVLWDSEAHDEVLIRTIKGLYYHHFNEILPTDSTIGISWHRTLNDDMIEISNQLKAHSISNGELIYRYGRADDKPESSIWLFQFYGKHWASGHTNVPEHNK